MRLEEHAAVRFLMGIRSNANDTWFGADPKAHRVIGGGDGIGERALHNVPLCVVLAFPGAARRTGGQSDGGQQPGNKFWRISR
jgi:hypothetical protein